VHTQEELEQGYKTVAFNVLVSRRLGRGLNSDLLKEKKYSLFKTVVWIRIRSDPKLLEGSGKNHSRSGQLRIRNEFEVKLL
jgi:hypothetical protein